MKKSLIALTLAALPVAAMADVTLYGQIKAGVEVSRVKTTTNGDATKSHTKTEIADFGSRIGFKGHEHLGNNLNAIWQLEQKASVAGTDANFGNRDSFIGLEGSFGKVRAGNLATVVDTADKGIDPWEYNNPALGLGTFTRTGGRDVSVRYDSPVFAGFSGAVQYQPRDNNAKSKRGLGNNPQDTYYAGLNYENSGFFAQYGAGFRKNGAASGSGSDGQAHRVVAGYDANNVAVAVAGQYAKGWETLGSYRDAMSGKVFGYDAAVKAVADGKATAQQVALVDANKGNVETTEVAVTGSYRFGNVTPKVSYAHGFKAKVAGEKLENSEYNQVVIGADYDFSKRTTALVSAGWLKAGSGDNKIENTAGVVGLRHKF